MDALLYFLLAVAFVGAGFKAGWVFWVVAAVFLWAAIYTLATA